MIFPLLPECGVCAFVGWELSFLGQTSVLETGLIHLSPLTHAFAHDFEHISEAWHSWSDISASIAVKL